MVQLPVVVGWPVQTAACGAVQVGGVRRVRSPVGPVDAAASDDPPDRSDLLRVDAQVGDQLPALNVQAMIALVDEHQGSGSGSTSARPELDPQQAGETPGSPARPPGPGLRGQAAGRARRSPWPARAPVGCGLKGRAGVVRLSHAEIIMLVDGAEQPSSNSGPKPLSEDQRKHLDFIQSVIARLASSSSTAKGWGLTVATAAFGFSATKSVPVVAGLGLVVVVFFGLLDSYYLREERLFRCLYDEARTGAIEVYSMKKDAYAERCTHRQVIRSWSVLGFYGPLLLVGLGALGWSICG
jgi:hypothetical protein